MKKTFLASMVIFSFLALVFLTGCDEYAGEAFRVIKQRSCSPYEEVHCEGQTLVTSTRDTACRINIDKQDCADFCSEVAKECVTPEEWDELVRESTSHEGQDDQDDGGDDQQDDPGDQDDGGDGADEDSPDGDAQDDEPVICEDEYSALFGCISVNTYSGMCSQEGGELVSFCADSDPSCNAGDVLFIEGCCAACIQEADLSGCGEDEACREKGVAFLCMANQFPVMYYDKPCMMDSGDIGFCSSCEILEVEDDGQDFGVYEPEEGTVLGDVQVLDDDGLALDDSQYTDVDSGSDLEVEGGDEPDATLDDSDTLIVESDNDFYDGPDYVDTNVQENDIQEDINI